MLIYNVTFEEINQDFIQKTINKADEKQEALDLIPRNPLFFVQDQSCKFEVGKN